MSRVHDALRKAAQHERPEAPKPPPRSETPAPLAQPLELNGGSEALAGISSSVEVAVKLDDLETIIQNAPVVRYNPAKGALLVSPGNPREAPAEEVRTLRTRLNHMQTLQTL